jgi:haloalkane dehalogenase
LEQGSGDPVLLLHGWPTSSYLWRNLLPVMAERNRVIAIDLPGYGRSDKPPDASYSFRYYDEILTGFLDSLGIEETGIAVHDLGGPVGLYWASQHPRRVSAVALLNTLVYTRLSAAAVAFLAGARIPLVRSGLVSPRGIAWAMRYGVKDKSKMTDETIAAYQEPFRTKADRRVLRRAAVGLHPAGLREIERWLPKIEVPVRIVYGGRDRILPDVERTMTKVARDVPAEVETTVLDCGHFLQEERPEEIAGLLSQFFVASPPRG